jgi:hypothetical protein
MIFNQMIPGELPRDPFAHPQLRGLKPYFQPGEVQGGTGSLHWYGAQNPADRVSAETRFFKGPGRAPNTTQIKLVISAESAERAEKIAEILHRQGFIREGSGTLNAESNLFHLPKATQRHHLEVH